MDSNKEPQHISTQMAQTAPKHRVLPKLRLPIKTSLPQPEITPQVSAMHVVTDSVAAPMAPVSLADTDKTTTDMAVSSDDDVYDVTTDDDEAQHDNDDDDDDDDDEGPEAEFTDGISDQDSEAEDEEYAMETFIEHRKLLKCMRCPSPFIEERAALLAGDEIVPTLEAHEDLFDRIDEAIEHQTGVFNIVEKARWQEETDGELHWTTYQPPMPAVDLVQYEELRDVFQPPGTVCIADAAQDDNSSVASHDSWESNAQSDNECVAQILYEEKRTDLCIDRKDFRLFSEEILQDYITDANFTTEAIAALQTVAEDHIVSLFQDVALATVSRKRKSHRTDPSDVQLVRRIRSER